MVGGKDDPERELDERLRRLLDASTDAVFLATTEGVVLHANAAACSMFGYGLDQLCTFSTKDLVVVDERFLALSADRRRNGMQRARLTLLRKGGERFEGEVTSAEIPSTSGEPRLWVVVHDLAEHRRAEEATRALRESEEKFRALAEASFEAIFLHRDGVILLANAATDRLYHAPPGGLIGRRLFDFVAPEDHEHVRRRMVERSEEPYEATGLRADGTTFPAEVHARTGPINFRGQATRVVAVRDVTVRKELEARLALAARMASLGTLAAGVAHEINNPLGALMLNVDLARKAVERGDADSAKLREMLDVAAESAERVQRIVRDLRALARPDDEERAAPIDLPAVMSYVENVARYDVRHRAKLEVKIAPLGPIYGNRARLEQVVLNLAVNAAQAIPEDGGEHRIEIEVMPHGDDRFAIEVRDTGVGIAPELRARIFDPFVTTKEVGGGTGLGLSICHAIVTSLGGTIDVESEPGKGSTFRVVLPRGAPPVEAPPAPRSTEPSPRGRVLVIDDERYIRDVLVQLLDMHDVTGVQGAHEALALLERGDRFDAILCDLMMPKMSGADFHDEVERRWPELLPRIILMTGGAVTRRAEEALRRAKNPPLEKPFPAPLLEGRVAELVRK